MSLRGCFNSSGNLYLPPQLNVCYRIGKVFHPDNLTYFYENVTKKKQLSRTVEDMDEGTLKGE